MTHGCGKLRVEYGIQLLKGGGDELNFLFHVQTPKGTKSRRQMGGRPILVDAGVAGDLCSIMCVSRFVYNNYTGRGKGPVKDEKITSL